MLRSDAVNICTLATFLRGQTQKLPNLIKRKPQIAAAANESQPALMLVRKSSIITFGSRGSREETNLLVIRNGHHLDSGRFRQISDTELLFRVHPLTL